MYIGDIREHMWCNGNTLARNARDVGLSLALGAIFPIFSPPTTLVAVQATHCMVVEPILCMYI